MLVWLQDQTSKSFKSFPTFFEVDISDLDVLFLFESQEVVSVQGDHERLLHIQGVIKELPTPHFR